MKITKKQLRKIIRESMLENRENIEEGLFSDITNMVAKKFGKIGTVSSPDEEKKNMGQAISRYITSVIKASREDESMKDKKDSEVKGGAVEAAKSAVQEIISAWEKGGS